MSRSWSRGSTRRWRTLRARVLFRDGYRCRAHADGWCALVPGQHTCTRVGTHAHHTKGRSITGDDERYIVASCEACNLHIGDPSKRSPEPKQVSRW